MIKQVVAIWGVAIAVLICGHASAQTYTQRTDIHMVVEPSTTVVGETLTVGADEPILVADAYSLRAVELLSDITIGGLDSGVKFSKGSVLFGRYDDTVWTYCGIATHTASTKAVNTVVLGVLTGGLSLLTGYEDTEIKCLYDADDDGTFESAWTGGIAVSDNAMVAFSLTETAMSSQTSYKRVDYTKGPIMPVEVKWAKNAKTGVITFTTIAGGISIQKKSISVPAIGAEPVEHSQFGAEFEVIGYDGQADKLTYQVKTGTKRSYYLVPAMKTITTQYTYY